MYVIAMTQDFERGFQRSDSIISMGISISVARLSSLHAVASRPNQPQPL
jgi:hypothetical protein